MKKKTTLFASVGPAILNESSHIDGKRDNTKHADKAVDLANILQIPPAEVPMILETLDKMITELDGHVSIYSAVDADRLRSIREAVYANARRSAETDQFAKSLFAQLGMDFDSDSQLDLIGADGTMTNAPDRTTTGAKAETLDPAIADHALHAGEHRPNGRDKTTA